MLRIKAKNEAGFAPHYELFMIIYEIGVLAWLLVPDYVLLTYLHPKPTLLVLRSLFLLSVLLIIPIMFLALSRYCKSFLLRRSNVLLGAILFTLPFWILITFSDYEPLFLTMYIILFPPIFGGLITFAIRSEIIISRKKRLRGEKTHLAKPTDDVTTFQHGLFVIPALACALLSGYFKINSSDIYGIPFLLSTLVATAYIFPMYWYRGTITL